MKPVFLHAFQHMRAQVLGWGISFAVVGWFVIFSYRPIAQEAAQIAALLKVYPPVVTAFFGDISKFFTPGGYLDLSFLSYGLFILGVFAVLAGSGMIAADEELGELDLIQSYPILRSALFTARFVALTAAVLAILFITWIGMVAGLPGSDFPVEPWDLALPMLATFAEMMLFASIALFFSMVLPSRSLAALTAGILLAASYFITSLAKVVGRMKPLDRFSPFSYYQSGYAVNGLDWGWFGGLLLAAAIFTLAAGLAYLMRNLRVSGEG